jgi:hypothetical protein
MNYNTAGRQGQGWASCPPGAPALGTACSHCHPEGGAALQAAATVGVARRGGPPWRSAPGDLVSRSLCSLTKLASTYKGRHSTAARKMATGASRVAPLRDGEGLGIVKVFLRHNTSHLGWIRRARLPRAPRRLRTPRRLAMTVWASRRHSLPKPVLLFLPADRLLVQQASWRRPDGSQAPQNRARSRPRGLRPTSLPAGAEPGPTARPAAAPSRAPASSWSRRCRTPCTARG